MVPNEETPSDVTDLHSTTNFGYHGTTELPLELDQSSGHWEKAFKVLIFITATSGLLSNLLVLYVIFVGHHIFCAKPSFILLIQQPVVDLYISVMVLASYIPWFTGIGRDSGDGFWGHVYCHLFVPEALLLAGAYANCLNVSAMAVERLIMVTKPIMYKNHFTAKIMTIVVIVTWIIAFVLTVHYVAMTHIEKGYCLSGFAFNSILFHTVYEYIAQVLSFFLPITAIIYSYIHSFVEIKNMKKKTAPSGSQSEGISNSQSSTKLTKGQINILKVMITISVVFLLTLTPHRVYLLLYTLGAPLTFSEPFFYMFNVLVILNSTINPFIYIFKCSEFQKQLRKVLKLGP